ASRHTGANRDPCCGLVRDLNMTVKSQGVGYIFRHDSTAMAKSLLRKHVPDTPPDCALTPVLLTCPLCARTCARFPPASAPWFPAAGRWQPACTTRRKTPA